MVENDELEEVMVEKSDEQVVAMENGEPGEEVVGMENDELEEVVAVKSYEQVVGMESDERVAKTLEGVVENDEQVEGMENDELKEVVVVKSDERVMGMVEKNDEPVEEMVVDYEEVNRVYETRAMAISKTDIVCLLDDVGEGYQLRLNYEWHLQSWPCKRATTE